MASSIHGMHCGRLLDDLREQGKNQSVELVSQDSHGQNMVFWREVVDCRK